MSEFPKIDIATQFHRNNAVPLDSTEIFYSLSAATDYVEKNSTVYTGQIITVVENNSISAFQITSEKKLDPILTENNTSNKFDEISTDFETIKTSISKLSSETSGDISTINDKITELSGIVDKNIDFIQAISVDLSDDISNIVEFNNKFFTLNAYLDELSGEHKKDIEELLSSLEETNNNISDLSVLHKDDIKDVYTKITYISGEIDNIYSDLSDDISNIYDLNVKISTLSSSIDNLSTKHNTEISELKQTIDDLSTTTTENITANRESILKLSYKIDGNTLLIDDLSIALDDLSGVFSEQSSNLEEKITNLSLEHKEDIDELSSSLEITNESIFELSGKHNLEIETLEEDITKLSDATFEAISKNTELINNLSSEIESSINELNIEINDISSQHKIDFKNLLSKTEDLSNEIDSISSEFFNEISGINSSIINIFDELISKTDNINELSDSVSSLNIYIDELSDKFETFENELSDKVPEYETDPVFNNWLSSSLAINIGRNAKVNNGSGVAIGKNSTASGYKGIAIGETAWSTKTGLAIGSNSNAFNDNAVAVGSGALVKPTLSSENSPATVQLGRGENTDEGTLQFRDYPLVDKNGFIFEERIPTNISTDISTLSANFKNLSSEISSYETDPKFTEWKNECSAVVIGKDAKINDSTNGVAIGLSATSNQNSIAIGMNAKASGPNRIVIGMNSISEYKGTAIGIGAASSGENSIAIGSDAKVYRNPNTDKEAGKGSIAIGISAIVDGAKNAVQLGEGTNTTDETLQFREYPLVDQNGQIYEERISNYVNEKITEVKSVINETYDYTAFEAWLLKETLPKGSTVSSIYDDTVFTAKKEITAGTCQAIYLWTYKDATEFTNIVIDWGDGNIEELDKITTLSTDDAGASAFIGDQVIEREYYLNIFNILYPEITGNVGSVKECFNQVPDFNYSVKYADKDGPTENYKEGKDLISDNATMYSVLHKYNIPDDKVELRPIIKVYGSNYFAITTGNTMYLTKSGTPKSFIYELKEKVNRLSRCFDKDLPIASNVMCLNGFTGSDNQTLFEVMVPEYYNWNSNLKDISGLFKSKQNLQRVRSTGQAERGTGNLLAKSFGMISAKGIFSGSDKLSSFYIRLPNYIGRPVSLASFFELNSVGSSLSMDVCDILPKEKFIDKEISVGELFKGCSNLSCSNEAKLSSYLWGDETIKWTNTGKAFEGCNDELRAMVPTTWGGTKTDWVSNRSKLLSAVNDMDITEIVSALLQII